MGVFWVCLDEGRVRRAEATATLPAALLDPFRLQASSPAEAELGAICPRVMVKESGNPLGCSAGQVRERYLTKSENFQPRHSLDSVHSEDAA